MQAAKLLNFKKRLYCIYSCSVIKKQRKYQNVIESIKKIHFRKNKSFFSFCFGIYE